MNESGQELTSRRLTELRQTRALASLALALALAGIWLGRLWDWPALTLARWLPLRCPLFAWFALPCPTCGFGRSLLLLAAGEWRASWSYHPLGMPMAALGGALLATSWLAPRAVARLWAAASQGASPILSLGFVAILLAVFLLRLVTGSLAVLAS